MYRVLTETPPYGKERLVRFLLECILVCFCFHFHFLWTGIEGWVTLNEGARESKVGWEVRCNHFFTRNSTATTNQCVKLLHFEHYITRQTQQSLVNWRFKLFLDAGFYICLTWIALNCSHCFVLASRELTVTISCYFSGHYVCLSPYPEALQPYIVQFYIVLLFPSNHRHKRYICGELKWLTDRLFSLWDVK